METVKMGDDMKNNSTALPLSPAWPWPNLLAPGYW